MLYGIDVHIFFPPTMFTPGYEAENKTKPKITLDIEGTDDGLSADQAALGMFKGKTSKIPASVIGLTSNPQASREGMFILLLTLSQLSFELRLAEQRHTIIGSSMAF
jgi:hypothetical protein